MPMIIPAIAAAGTWVGSPAIFGTAVAGGLTTAGSIAASVVSGAIYGAIGGAIVGGGTAAIKGGDIGKGALNGAMYGAAGGAIIGAASGIYSAATGGAASGAAGGGLEAAAPAMSSPGAGLIADTAAPAMSSPGAGFAPAAAANVPNAGGSLAGGGGEIINKNMQNKVETPPPPKNTDFRDYALIQAVSGLGKGFDNSAEKAAKEQGKANREIAEYNRSTQTLNFAGNNFTSFLEPLPQIKEWNKTKTGGLLNA